MKIAILGAGYAGLSVCWNLINFSNGSVAIDLFDPVPVGAGASGLSSGLLHQFTGKKAIKQVLGDQGMESSHKLITAATRYLGKSVVLSRGILRPASSPEQLSIFKQRIEEFPEELEWWDSSHCEVMIEGISIDTSLGAMFIKNGLTIDNDAYLEGLFMGCTTLGTQFYDETIEDIDEIREAYDHIIVTPGANFSFIPSLQDLPLSKVKGQILKINWPKEMKPLPFSVNSHKYMVANTAANTCILGATFEHNEIDESPDFDKAYGDIVPKLQSLFPFLSNADISEYSAGMRASTPTKRPIIGKTEDGIWFLAGLGSKGLLYHGLAGEMLAQAVLSNNFGYIDSNFFFDTSKK